MNFATGRTAGTAMWSRSVSVLATTALGVALTAGASGCIAAQGSEGDVEADRAAESMPDCNLPTSPLTGAHYVAATTMCMATNGPAESFDMQIAKATEVPSLKKLLTDLKAAGCNAPMMTNVTFPVPTSGMPGDPFGPPARLASLNYAFCPHHSPVIKPKSDPGSVKSYEQLVDGDGEPAEVFQKTDWIRLPISKGTVGKTSTPTTIDGAYVAWDPVGCGACTPPHPTVMH